MKALIFNAAMDSDIGKAFERVEDILPNSIIGHGIPDDKSCLYSSENSATIILEDDIHPDNIQSYPIQIPKYLIDIDQTSSLLKVKATLCFKFEPLKHHYLAYNPLHISFGVFRNKPLEDYAYD
ncbi:MAG: hypothetical protein SGJ10_15005 [Bacteroidota bacterium]|nr:hypothetical protein [Bacteroidota bacterium]